MPRKSFIKRVFTFFNEDEAFLAHHLMLKQKQRNWQFEFEDKNIISPPDCFQYYFYVTKLAPILRTVSYRFIIVSNIVNLFSLLLQ